LVDDIHLIFTHFSDPLAVDLINHFRGCMAHLTCNKRWVRPGSERSVNRAQACWRFKKVDDVLERFIASMEQARKAGH